MELGAPEIQIAVSLVVVLGTAFIALVCDFLKGNNEQLRERNIELRAREDERSRLGLNQPLQWLQSLAALIRQPAPEARPAEKPAPPSREPELAAPVAPAPEPEAPSAWATKEELEQLAGRAARLRARHEQATQAQVASEPALARLSPAAAQVPEVVAIPEPAVAPEAEAELETAAEEAAATPAPVIELPVSRESPDPPGGGGLPVEQSLDAEPAVSEAGPLLEPEPVAPEEPNLPEAVGDREPVVTSYATAWEAAAGEPAAEETAPDGDEFFRPSWAVAAEPPTLVEPLPVVPEPVEATLEPSKGRVLSISIASPERGERTPLELEDELRRVGEPEPSGVSPMAAEETGPLFEEPLAEPEPTGGTLPSGLQSAAVLSSLMEDSAPFSGVAVAIGINDYETLREKLNSPESGDALGPVTMMVQALLRSQDMACRFLDDEYILLFPGESGPAAQRRLFQISEKLWDFQLRSLGNLAMMFSWGGLELNAEPLAEGVAAARERMYQTRRNRKPTALSPLARRRVVNG
jgi:hypothetical protein